MLFKVPFSLKNRQKKSYKAHKQDAQMLYQVGAGIVQRMKQEGEMTRTTMREGFGLLREGQVEIHGAILDQTEVIYKGFNAVELTLQEGFEGMAYGLKYVSDTVSEKVEGVGENVLVVGDRLEKGLGEMRASFDMGMMSIVSQFELQRDEIQVGFEKLAHFLANSRKLEARERFLDGVEAYHKYLRFPDESQFLKDAYDYLQKSLAIYKGNAFCHFYLGHIYQEASELFDVAKAQEHYQLCATYAKGDDNKGLAALGYFMAAWCAYAQGNLPEAIELSKQSLEFDPDRNPEAWYNLAKYYAYQSNSTQAIVNLDIAIQQFDPLYTLKASLDEDFTNIQSDLLSYFRQIRDHEAEKWTKQLNEWGEVRD